MALENNCYGDTHDVMCFNNFLQVWQTANGCKIIISFEKAARIIIELVDSIVGMSEMFH